MRIDLPLCGLDSCRYSFDGNCTSKSRYKSCEFAYFQQLEADDRLIKLPCKVGDTVYEIYRFCIYGAWEIDEHRVTLEDLPHIGKTVFLTKEEAEAKLAELKGDKQ